MAQIAIDQNVADLANKMRDVYSFVDAIEAVPSKIGLLEDIIRRIFNQTAECGMFIQEYTGHGFGGRQCHTSKLSCRHGLTRGTIIGRVLKEAMGASTPAKVARMMDSLTTLNDQFNTGVTIQIATVSFRIQEDVAILRK